MTSKSDAINRDFWFARVLDLSFDAVNELWRKRQSDGLKQIELAEKLGRDTGWVSKKLRGPGNWTLRTLGELVGALEGELEIRVAPLEQPLYARSNYDAYRDMDDNEDVISKSENVKARLTIEEPENKNLPRTESRSENAIMTKLE